ncbi:hypothetical protein C1I98_24365 [Spongiactinospora gelatinilytica]|uniref:Tetratricopeptide repeat protein n=1 Tax=Spongiactinospora gelatinilytica TaxID=2666298 RepID=A0A2W2FR61_9ACTN|nr:tetratricopeptide repeat protein [Spongiactinospora gelatinilytica]PZG38223.1 hypothetical protein C1I98_24365 [Spongiactinospora gelatinilytica]
MGRPPHDDLKAAFLTATALAADRALAPGRRTLAPGQAVTSEDALSFRTAAAALAWLDANYEELLRVIVRAAESGPSVHAWQLTWALTTYFAERQHWHDWLWTTELAIPQARALGDDDAERRLLRNLCRCRLRLGHHEDAIKSASAALESFAAAGDRYGLAHTHLSLSYALERLGRLPEATAHARTSLTAFEQAEDDDGRASALTSLARLCALRGEPRDALAHASAAITLFEALDNPQGTAAGHHTCGRASADLDRHEDAVAHYQRAIEVIEAAGGNAYYRSLALRRIAASRRHLGDLPAAGDALREAHRLLSGLDHPEAAEVAAELTHLNDTDNQDESWPSSTPSPNSSPA